jgi:hypothetical protein
VRSPSSDPVAAGSGARGRRYSEPVTSPQTPRPERPVEYKGEPLDAARGPGLGCFWAQVVILVVFVILTPLSVSWGWPPTVSALLLFAVILLLLFTGQTMIFLLRLVAAGRSEGRRRPLASPTPTVGELEDEQPATAAPGPEADGPAASAEGAAPAPDAGPADRPRDDAPGMRE